MPIQTVGAVRMNSLSLYLNSNTNHNIYVICNNPRYYEDTSDEKVPCGIKTFYVDIDDKQRKSFFSNCNKYKVKLQELYNQIEIDLVIISVGPFYTLPLTKYIKSISKCKIVLDYRDLWIKEDVYAGIYGLRKILLMVKNLAKTILFEKGAIERADKFVTVSMHSTAYMKKKYKKSENFFVTIYNGYDDSLLSNIVNSNDNYKSVELSSQDELKMCVFGKFGVYSPEMIPVLIDALKQVYPEKCKKILHIGKEECEVTRIFHECKNENFCYESTGYKEYQEGIKLLEKNDISLIIQRESNVGRGTKVFDYIFVNNPIICILYPGDSDSEIRLFLGQFENAFVCNTKDEIICAINKIVSENIRTLSSESNIISFGRRIQNETYSRLIESM